jgi:hypothetical protein
MKMKSCSRCHSFLCQSFRWWHRPRRSFRHSRPRPLDSPLSRRCPPPRRYTRLHHRSYHPSRPRLRRRYMRGRVSRPRRHASRCRPRHLRSSCRCRILRYAERRSRKRMLLVEPPCNAFKPVFLVRASTQHCADAQADDASYRRSSKRSRTRARAQTLRSTCAGRFIQEWQMLDIEWDEMVYFTTVPVFVYDTRLMKS